MIQFIIVHILENDSYRRGGRWDLITNVFGVSSMKTKSLSSMGTSHVSEIMI